MFWFSQKNNSLIFPMKNPTSWICILHLQQLIFFKTMKIWKGRQHIKIKCSTPLKKRCCKKKNYKYIKKIRFRFKFNLRWWYKQLIMQSLIIRFIINLSIYVWIIERIHERVNVFWKYQSQCFSQFGIFSIGTVRVAWL